MGHLCPEYCVFKKNNNNFALGEAAQQVLCKDYVSSVQNCFLCLGLG